MASGSCSFVKVKDAIVERNKAKVLRLVEQDDACLGQEQNWALRFCAEHGLDELVEILLKSPSVRPNVFSNLPFRAAVELGHVKTALLLAQDARVDVGDRQGEALVSACQNGHVELLDLLLAKSVDPSCDSNSAIGLAAKNGHFEICQRLLSDARVDPAADSNYAVRMAAKGGFMEVVELLLEDTRVNPTERINGGISAVGQACLNGHLEIVQFFISRGVNVAVNQNEMLREAVKSGNSLLVKFLLKEPGVDASINDFEVVRIAAAHGSTSILHVLLQKDNQLLPTGALAAAIAHNQVDCVRILLEDTRINVAKEISMAQPVLEENPPKVSLQVMGEILSWEKSRTVLRPLVCAEKASQVHNYLFIRAIKAVLFLIRRTRDVQLQGSEIKTLKQLLGDQLVVRIIALAWGRELVFSFSAWSEVIEKAERIVNHIMIRRFNETL